MMHQGGCGCLWVFLATETKAKLKGIVHPEIPPIYCSPRSGWRLWGHFGVSQSEITQTQWTPLRGQRHINPI